MKVYILELQSRNREQMLKWLQENKRVDNIEAFEDYVGFVEQAGKSPPDFCFIRLGMDGIPGLKAAGFVQQINKDIRIVFLSDDRDYAIHAFEAGAFDYLLCPVERKRLDELLKGA